MVDCNQPGNHKQNSKEVISFCSELAIFPDILQVPGGCSALCTEMREGQCKLYSSTGPHAVGASSCRGIDWSGCGKGPIAMPARLNSTTQLGVAPLTTSQLSGRERGCTTYRSLQLLSWARPLFPLLC